MSAPPTQDGRLMSISSDLGADTLLLRGFRGTESMSAPFSIEAEVLATRAVNSDELLATPVAIQIDDGGGPRVIHGLVRALTAAGRDEEFFLYRLQIVPWLWFLSLNTDCRVFQQKNVQEIVEQVFQDRGYSDFQFRLQGTHPVREFTVQYQESDLDFVSRLLEEEGIFYFFEHAEHAHTLLLGDHQGALEEGPVQSDVKLWNVGGGIPGERVIHEVTVDMAVYPGESTLKDYDYLKPSTDLTKTVTGEGSGSLYEYPGGYSDAQDGEALATVRLEAEEAKAEVLRGRGDCYGLMPGYRFQLTESDADGEYVVSSVRHDGGEQSYRSGSGEDQEEDLYLNSFTAIPYGPTPRPQRRTPRPHLGVQTAVVVGPQEGEIHNDEHGRVKVRFHWDRESPEGDSSCWIRVATTWAGNSWGAIHIPRIGQEVIVEFLNGDPNRPLITGSVYNAEQMPPWDATPTQSGWKSHSTKEGGAESNELRFEDKIGEEEVYIRAEKDLTFEVVNNETGTVGNDRTTTIENDDTKTVRHDETTTIENDRAVTVEANETMKVAKNRDRKVSKNEKVSIDGKQTIAVGGDQTVTVSKGNQTVTVSKGNRKVQVKMGNLDTKVDLGKITYEAMQSIELKVGSNSIKIDPMGVTIKGMMVKVEGQIMTEIKGTMVKVDGSAMLMAKGGITMIG